MDTYCISSLDTFSLSLHCRARFSIARRHIKNTFKVRSFRVYVEKTCYKVFNLQIWEFIMCFPKIITNRIKSCFFCYVTYSLLLLKKLSGSQLVKKFPACYRTRKLITAFTSARHLHLS